MKKIFLTILLTNIYLFSYCDDFIVISGNSKLFISETEIKFDTPFKVGDKSVILWYGASANFIGTSDNPSNSCLYGVISDEERNAVSKGKKYKKPTKHYLYDADNNKLYLLSPVK